MKVLDIDDAPAAIGPYSHAVRTGDLVFCSGQTPIDPSSGELVGTTIEEQTQRVLANLRLVLGGQGLGLADVVRTNVYLADMDDFAGMNVVYGHAFGDHRPARTTIAVKQNPLGALVEIDCVAEVSR